MSEVNFDLLDDTIDNLADLEAFEPLPEGSYRLANSWETKEINGKPAVIQKLTVLEVLELASSTATPPEAGKSCDIAYILTRDDGEPNTVGQGQFKEQMTFFKEYVGGEKPREIMENSEGAEIIATLKVRANKKDPDQKFNSIKAVVWPE